MAVRAWGGIHDTEADDGAVPQEGLVALTTTVAPNPGEAVILLVSVKLVKTRTAKTVGVSTLKD